MRPRMSPRRPGSPARPARRRFPPADPAAGRADTGLQPADPPPPPPPAAPGPVGTPRAGRRGDPRGGSGLRGQALLIRRQDRRVVPVAAVAGAARLHHPDGRCRSSVTSPATWSPPAGTRRRGGHSRLRVRVRRGSGLSVMTLEKSVRSGCGTVPRWATPRGRRSPGRALPRRHRRQRDHRVPGQRPRAAGGGRRDGVADQPGPGTRGGRGHHAGRALRLRHVPEQRQRGVFDLQRALSSGFGSGDAVGLIPVGPQPIGIAIPPMASTPTWPARPPPRGPGG